MNTTAVMKYEIICGDLCIDPALPFKDENFILFMESIKKMKDIKPPKHWELIKNFLKENY